MKFIDSIKTYICAELAPDIAPDDLPNDCDLLSTGVIDSLSLMRLVIWIGEEFGIPVADIDIAPEDFRSVLKINEFISKNILLAA